MELQKITLSTAVQLISAGETYASSIHLPVVLTVLDGAGCLICQHRMDEALLASIDLSKEKAYTSVALKMTTEEVFHQVEPGASLYGLQHTGRYCIFGGGIPLFYKNHCIGAVGVSGGTVQQDIAVATVMEQYFYGMN